jgi:hypothetical protein
MGEDNMNQETERIRYLFSDLDLNFWKHYSLDKNLNEKRKQQIIDLKIRVLKNGLDQTIKEISFARL